MNLVLSQASCFAAAILYNDNIGYGGRPTVELPSGDATVAVVNATALDEHAEEREGFPPSAVMAILQVSFALWVLSLFGFFASIDKAYLHSFFDFASGKQFAVREFRNAKTPFERLQIFCYHKSYYAAIQGEIKAWLKENYEVFEAEKPLWWTELLISTIPDDYIPKEELKLLEEKGPGGKRKKSVVSLGGRVSFVEGGDGGGEAGEGVVAGLARRLSVGSRRGSKATVVPAAT